MFRRKFLVDLMSGAPLLAATSFGLALPPDAKAESAGLVTPHSRLSYQPLWPPFEKIQTRLRQWEREYTHTFRLRVIGKSAEGRPIYAAHLTDQSVAEEMKEHVLITAQHSGIERSGTTSVFCIMEWLLSGDPLARKVLKRQTVVCMPVVNPDGYVNGSHANTMGMDPYADWTLEGPKAPGKMPEAVAVKQMMDELRPEVQADCHGVDLAFPGNIMMEESGEAVSNVALRPYHRAIVSQMNAAAAGGGYPSDLLENDAEKLYWGPELDSIREKLWTGRSRPYAAIYCYGRYHTLVLASEMAWEQSALLRHRRLLELGNSVWPGEYYSGYPTRIVASNYYHQLSAYGQTAADRRKSRVELWNKLRQISMGFNNPPVEGMALLICATSPSAVGRWLKDRSLGGFVNSISENPRIDSAAIRSIIERYPHPSFQGQWGAEAQIFLSGGGGKSVEESRIQHGLSLRVRIQYPKSQLKAVRLNGKPIPPSETDGYVTWVARSFRYVQVNVPPRASMSEDLFIVTCEYEPGEKRIQGIQNKSWLVS